MSDIQDWISLTDFRERFVAYPDDFLLSYMEHPDPLCCGENPPDEHVRVKDGELQLDLNAITRISLDNNEILKSMIEKNDYLFGDD